MNNWHNAFSPLSQDWPFNQYFPIHYSIPSAVKNRLSEFIRIFGEKQFYSNYKLWAQQQKNYTEQGQSIKVLIKIKFIQFFKELQKYLDDQKQLQFLHLKYDIVEPNQQLLIKISQFNLSSLKILVLRNLSIHSIEPISWIDCKTLESIVLDDNLITNFKSLAKTNFYGLSKLSLLNTIGKIDDLINSSCISHLNHMKMNKIPAYNYLISYFNWIRLSLSTNQPNSDLILDSMFVKLQKNENGFNYGSLIDLENYRQLIYTRNPKKMLLSKQDLQIQQNWRTQTWNFITEK